MATSLSNNHRFANPPSLVKHGKCRFLIMDAPTDSNLSMYIDEMKLHNVRLCVRTCEPTYNEESLHRAGIETVDIAFPDGTPPSPDTILTWLQICKAELAKKNQVVAVHCVAGFGRSAVLVAIALMEMVGMTASDAVEKIRSARRGSLNHRQVMFLSRYEAIKHRECCVVL